MSLENESTGSLLSLKWKKHRSTIVEEAGDSDSDDAQLQELSDALNRVIISDISENVLFYIAGFIVRKLKRQIDCSICSEALLLNSSPSATSDCRETPSHELFLERRNNGGLIKVSYGVYSTHGPRIELFFPPCKIIDLRMILYLRMTLQLNRLNNYAIDTS